MVSEDTQSTTTDTTQSTTTDTTQSTTTGTSAPAAEKTEQHPMTDLTKETQVPVETGKESPLIEERPTVELMDLNSGVLDGLNLGKHIAGVLVTANPELSEQLQDKLPTFKRETLVPQLQKLGFNEEQLKFLGGAIKDAVTATSKVRDMEETQHKLANEMEKDRQLQMEFGRSFGDTIKPTAENWLRQYKLPADFLSHLSIEDSTDFHKALMDGKRVAELEMSRHSFSSFSGGANQAAENKEINAFYARRKAT